MPIVLAGGVQKPTGAFESGTHRYDFARLLELGEDGRERVLLDYRSPSEHVAAEDPSVVFTAGHLERERMWVPTKTEVLELRRDQGFVPVKVHSLPCFNDVHHACPDPEDPTRIWLVNTGLDQVLRLGPEGELELAYSVLGGDPWARFARGEQWRHIDSTKPHASHPNYLLFWEGKPWVTRFKQRDCVALEFASEAVEPSPHRMPIGFAGCHDGHVTPWGVYFTTVDGRIARTRPGLERPERVWDLNAMDGGLRRLGWCRGLVVLGEQRVLVGFSRLRVTRWAGNVAWAGGMNTLRALRHRPTRVACFDLAAGRLEWERELEQVDAVFSIHAEGPAAEGAEPGAPEVAAGSASARGAAPT